MVSKIRESATRNIAKRGGDMAERPLILFPTPEIANKSRLGGGAGNFRLPAHQRQGERLIPQFNQLEAAFSQRRIDILATVEGIDPEQALVIETIGSIESFNNAVRRIEGLEWLGEFEIDGVIPDQDFFDPKRPDKEISGRLYFVMTNQQALNEMLSLWRGYQANSNYPFQHGFARFRDIFKHLKTIRRWDVQDRLLETGVIEAWNKDLDVDGDWPIRFEIELWFRENEEKRGF